LVLADAPKQITARAGGLAPQLESVEEAIRQAKHAGLQVLHDVAGQSDFTRGVRTRHSTKEHMSTILHQGDKAQLREGASWAATNSGSAKGLGIRCGVSEIHDRAVQTNDAPGSEEGIRRFLLGDGTHF